MPIRRGSVSVARFRVQGDVPKDTRRWVLGALKEGAFEPIDVKGEEERTAGFCELEAANRTEFNVGDVFLGTMALFAWRVDKLKVPTMQIRAEMLRWGTAFEQKNSRAPGRREKAEQKEVIKRSLRSKLDPVTKTFDVSLDLVGKEVLIWATSRTMVDEIAAVLESKLEVKLIGRMPAAFMNPDVLDALMPTPALFGEL